MNVYKLITGSVIYLIAAHTVIVAIREYFNETGDSFSDFDTEDDINLVPKEKWEDCIVTDTYNNNKKTILAEHMKTINSPEIIACSEE